MTKANESLKEFRVKNLKIGRKRTEFYLTDDEKIELKSKLKELRK